jgi:OOP family OmpA-OmpF porin
MKKLNKVAVLFAAAALAAPDLAAFAQWRARSTTGAMVTAAVWKNGTNELCWRDANWTPATAKAACDGAIKPPSPPPAAAPAPAPRVRRRPPRAGPAPARPAPPPPAARPAAPVSEKVTFAADAFFDVDKSVLKPEAKAKLDDLVSKTKGINLEVIIAVGHTDSDGSDAYNQKLSVRRADAVKAYLVEQGCREEPRLHRRQGREAAGRRQQDQGRQGEEPPRRDRGRRYPHQEVIRAFGPVTRPASCGVAHETPPRRGFVFVCKCLPLHRHATHVQRRRPGTRQVQRTGPPLVGPRQRVPPAAQINPLRLDWIDSAWPAAGQAVLDVGCGGGILAESMARVARQSCTGIDLRLQAAGRGASCTRSRPASPNLDYREMAAEALAAERPASFDVVTCMEMLEHVPDPASVVRACAATGANRAAGCSSRRSTATRSRSCSPSSVPSTCCSCCPGTHEYARFIRPSELARCAATPAWTCGSTRGMAYNPLTRATGCRATPASTTSFACRTAA